MVHRGSQFNIVLEDISIVDLTFGRDFTNAVEQKQVAQQEAERARYVVEKVKKKKIIFGARIVILFFMSRPSKKSRQLSSAPRVSPSPPRSSRTPSSSLDRASSSSAVSRPPRTLPRHCRKSATLPTCPPTRTRAFF